MTKEAAENSYHIVLCYHLHGRENHHYQGNSAHTTLFCFITSQSCTVMIKIMTQLVNRELNHKSHIFSGLWLMACGIACELGITGNESWCHYHLPSSKQSSLTWKQKNLPSATKTRSKTSAGKVMLALFFDVSGSVQVEWTPIGTTINAARYVDTLMKLNTNIKNYRKGSLSRGIVLLHNNTRPHTAGLTVYVDNTEI